LAFVELLLMEVFTEGVGFDGMTDDETVSFEELMAAT
jgi:hypothetical protein